jgi:phosphate ABC transporter phosphate-binding protein
MNTARKMRARLTVLVAAILTGLCVGIIAPAQSASAATFVPITGSGSTWAYPAIHRWISSVAQQGLAVKYQPNGSSSGRTFFAGGQSDFAASEIPYGVVDGANTDSPPARGYAYMPDVAGGLGFMYNLQVNGQRVTNLRLSGKTIADIFTNKVTFWDDPEIQADNPLLALPHLLITPVVRSDGDGSTAVFTQWMLATQPSDWQSYCAVVGRSPCTQTSTFPVQGGTDMIAQPGDPGVATYVAQSSSNGAIGYAQYSWALQEGLPVAKVLNAAGYYTAPTAANVAVSLLQAQVNTDPSSPDYLTADLSGVYTNTDPRNYELSYYSYMIIPTDLSNGMTTGKGYTLGAFGQYLLCQGQQQVDALGYSALPINLVEDGFAQLQKIPGANVPATTAAFIASCDNPTFSTDGTNTLAADAPNPPACDKEGATQCAGPTTTVVVLTASPNPVTAGQAVTLTATVTSGSSVPAGLVEFEVGGTLIGDPVALDSSGVATVTTTFSVAGTDTMSAVFTPTDPGAVTGATGTLSLTVQKDPNVSTIPLATTVPAVGTFTFTVDTANTVTLAVSGNSATAATPSMVVSDTRNTYPGWEVVGQAGDFIGSGTAAGSSFSGNQLGWTPTGSSLASGVTLGGTITPASPGLGSAPAFLASAHAGTGYGTSTFGANLTLAIPPAPESAAGNYTSSLTVTAVTALS